jgi:DNA-binding IclR family transcriptional regulator
MGRIAPELMQEVNEPADSLEDEDVGHGVAAVNRALSIVNAIAQASGPLTLADLSRETGFYKSTLLRLIISLETAAYVARLRDGRYTLGPTAFRLGHAYERLLKLDQHVLPVLNDLAQDGTESPSFHVRQDKETRVCLFRVNSNHSTLDRVAAGDVLPLRQGAAGQILLAFDAEPGEKFENLRQEMWVASYGERDPICAGIAAPVFGADNSLAGALSLSGPRERFTKDAVETMRRKVLLGAATITGALGGNTDALIERANSE